jgi:NAD(P)-dependent dehydrogenase (short-subunit alcohol dehydrogenase family)
MRVELVQCDLAGIRAAKDAADEIKHKTDRLDILICNAGTPSASAGPISKPFTRSPLLHIMRFS